MEMPGGGVALVTVEAPRRQPCAFCGVLSDTLCDYPLRALKKKNHTCSKRVCKGCVTSIGKNLDLCPVHAEFCEQHGLGARIAPLLDEENADGHAVALDLIEQTVGVELSRPTPNWTPRDLADWREFFRERAAIFEYDGGFPREIAERKALAIVGPRPRG